MKMNSRREEAASGGEAPPTLRGGPTISGSSSKKDHPAAGSVPPSYGSAGSGGKNAEPEAGAGRQGKKSPEEEQIEQVMRDAEKYVTD